MLEHATHDDIIWLSGILEGEGTFDLHRGKYPRIRVEMCDRDVVGRVATLLDAKLRLTLRPRGRKATWHAEKSGPVADAYMRAVLPHMGARRSARIAEVLGATTGRQPGPKMTMPPGLVRAP